MFSASQVTGCKLSWVCWGDFRCTDWSIQSTVYYYLCLPFHSCSD